MGDLAWRRFRCFCKALQKRLFSLLLHRSCCLIMLTGLFSGVVLWLYWSSSTIHPFWQDNLLARSLRDQWCQLGPIDAVFTWVNGSDPWFIDQLRQSLKRLHPEAKSIRHRVDRDCWPSHFVLAKIPSNLAHLSVPQLQTWNKPLLDQLIGIRRCEEDHLNRTLLIMASVEMALQASRSRVLRMSHESVKVKATCWTRTADDTSIHLPDFVLTPFVGPDPDDLMQIVSGQVSDQILASWLFDQWALVQLARPLDWTSRNTSFRSDPESGLLYPAFLTTMTPDDTKEEEEEMHQTDLWNRFDDHDELRYSLRSLEKFAPWVRRVFLVTNGQIPSWLNLHHPRLTLITHQDIFPDTSHLPTFSSPAIEANLFRIPGLSEKFLYFNDDIFLGERVYPEDFYTEQSGHKIYLSWPVPDCAANCPSSWMNDGYCDLPCNSSRCLYDGGDCVASNPQMAFSMHFPNIADQRPNGPQGPHSWSCNELCPNSWLGDGLCDDSCDLMQCGFDGGDCGLDDGYRSLPQLNLTLDSSQHFQLSSDISAAFINISAIYDPNQELDVVIPSKHRWFWAQVNIELQVVTFVFPQWNERNMNRSAAFTLERSFQRNGEEHRVTQFQIFITFQSANSTTNPYIQKNKLDFDDVPMNPVNAESSQGKPTSSKFDDSLWFVNGLYSEEYGFAMRRVVAHMPHFIHVSIFRALVHKFAHQWSNTSSHVVRSSQDMQFSFAYFYFLMSEKKPFQLEQLFKRFDTDQSNSWSDREIRTLLTQIYNLPLNQKHVEHFEEMIKECWHKLPQNLKNFNLLRSTPTYERYLNSHLPLIDMLLVRHCPDLVDMLRTHFSNQPKYPFQIMTNGDDKFSFKSLTSNVSQVISALDDLRKNPRKFYCLNDDLDRNRPSENRLIRSIMLDFLESMLPTPSSFELPPSLRNRYLHLNELHSRLLYRSVVLALLFALLIVLLLFVIFC